MGILNVTPDSFSDGGKFITPELAEQRIGELLEQGADIIDIGAESTGPGSKEVTKEEELARLKSVVEMIGKKKLVDKITFSIDTYKASVAEYALNHGFKMVNDVTALRGDPKMIETLVKYKPHVVLMYSKDPSARTTKDVVEYDDVVKTVSEFLMERVNVLLRAGFPKDKIILDPGMGTFVSGNPKYSFELIERLKELKQLGFPILIGISRKSCLGGILEDRDQPSVEWSMKAIKRGADIIRIHHVEMMKERLQTFI